MERQWHQPVTFDFNTRSYFDHQSPGVGLRNEVCTNNRLGRRGHLRIPHDSQNSGSLGSAAPPSYSKNVNPQSSLEGGANNKEQQAA